MSDWQDVSTAPYETKVLTFWPGSAMANPVILINSKNSGTLCGKKDGWWHSHPNQPPTHWMPLPELPTMQALDRERLNDD